MRSPATASSDRRWLVAALLAAALSLGAFLFAPRLQAALFQRRAAATQADLAAFATALQAHAASHGDWPVTDALPGSPPPGIAATPLAAAWSAPTPLGGRYVWEPYATQRGSRHRAAVAIASVPGDSVSSDRRQLLALDRLMDDGDLATGRLQLGYRDQPVLILEH